MNFKELLPKNLPFLKSAEKAEYYFALNIGTDSLMASVWGINGKNLQLLNVTELRVSGDDDLVEAANNALDEALGDFPFDPEKILFGVPDSWMIDDNLKETHLEFLKQLVKELDVSPMAYVSTSHAISHMLQRQTGVPTTAILIGVADPLVVTLVKGGKVLGTKTVKRSEDLPQDIERALKHFPDIEVLPSKIALYGSGNLEKYHDELLGFNWMNSLPFLHLPKVEVLESRVAIKAVSLAGASEINPDINYPHQGISAEPVAGGGSSRGLQMHRNIANLAPVAEPTTAAAFPAQAHVAQRGSVRGAGQYQHQPGISNSKFSSLDSVKAKMFSYLGFLKMKGGGIKLPGRSGARIDARIIAPVAVLVLLLLGYLFLMRASVTIFIDPKILEKDAQVVEPRSSENYIVIVFEAMSNSGGKSVEPWLMSELVCGLCLGPDVRNHQFPPCCLGHPAVSGQRGEMRISSKPPRS